MSKKNIVDRKDVGDKVHLTFKTSGGLSTYEYTKRQAGYLKRGSDPANLHGRLVNHEKKKD